MKRLISLKSRPAWTGLLIGSLLILSACSPSNAPAASVYPTPAASAVSTQAAAPAPAATSSQAGIPVTGSAPIQVVNDPQLGQILMTSAGLALYANTVDSPEQLHCTNAACTGFWPPYIVSGQPAAVDGLPGSLGTVTRPDGSQQLTYNEQPLYTFYLDKGPTDAKGNGFTDLGGTWHVVTPAGAPASSNPSPVPTSAYGGYQY